MFTPDCLGVLSATRRPSGTFWRDIQTLSSACYFWQLGVRPSRRPAMVPSSSSPSPTVASPSPAAASPSPWDREMVTCRRSEISGHFRGHVCALWAGRFDGTRKSRRGIRRICYDCGLCPNMDCRLDWIFNVSIFEYCVSRSGAGAVVLKKIMSVQMITFHVKWIDRALITRL